MTCCLPSSSGRPDFTKKGERMEPNPPEIELAKISKLDTISLFYGANQTAENFGHTVFTNTFPIANMVLPTMTQINDYEMSNRTSTPIMVSMLMIVSPSLMEYVSSI